MDEQVDIIALFKRTGIDMTTNEGLHAFFQALIFKGSIPSKYPTDFAFNWRLSDGFHIMGTGYTTNEVFRSMEERLNEHVKRRVLGE